MKDQPKRIKDVIGPIGTIDKAAILKQRAVALAARQDKTEKESQSIEVLVFSLGSERYGVGSETVREVCPVRQITRVPCVPSFVMGIINVRGKIFSVLDIRRLLNLPEAKSRNQEKVIIIGFKEMEVGILAGQLDPAAEARHLGHHQRRRVGQRVDAVEHDPRVVGTFERQEHPRVLEPRPGVVRVEP